MPTTEPTPVPTHVGIRVAYPDGSDLECSETKTIGWYTQSLPLCTYVDLSLFVAGNEPTFVTSIASNLANTPDIEGYSEYQWAEYVY